MIRISVVLDILNHKVNVRPRESAKGLRVDRQHGRIFEALDIVSQNPLRPFIRHNLEHLSVFDTF